MKFILLSLCVGIFGDGVNTLLAQQKLVILGSSTSACANVDYNQCYVSLLNNFYNQQAPFDTIIDGHLARYGTNCYNGMPTSYNGSPYAGYQPIPDTNISTALTLNPSVIIVNYPTNGYALFRTDSILYCLRTIRDSANKKGIPCYITTTQPRTSPDVYNTPAQKRKMAELKDSILAEFGNFAIDFWTGLINLSDTSILYDSGDHIHMNAQGHQILFQRIIEKNIFSATLPATFIQYNSIFKNNSIIVSWQTASETAVANYEIERSVDGLNFSRVGTVIAKNSLGNNLYQYIDEQPLNGWCYYKIQIVDQDGQKHSSALMHVFTNNQKLNISKVYFNNNQELTAELQNNSTQQVELQLFNNIGSIVYQTTQKIETGYRIVTLSVPMLSQGIYHLRLTAGQQEVVHSFAKRD